MNKFFSFLSRALGGEAAVKMINRSSDIILAVWIMAVIIIIILPVPAAVIDFLITFNLTAAVAILMVSLYIPSAVHLSMFPSLLLITTLFRLGVNIASTRLILLKAYAGEIIQAFGQFVVGGNYVVGFVVFIIITIVQFIVVIKGAERVAEVAARFRLDAMPGKQMAIDADLRAGVIDASMAREKRSMIQRESELYGAMDGAMKFVKGDVIAGMVIAFVNIVGGLIIGMGMHNMSLAQAAHVYTLLSIGDGLVSQIPSLLIALTAGIVTTRVTSERKDANLGREISEQIFREPRAIFIAAAATFGIGLFKGFPLWSFSILAILLFAAAVGLTRKKKKLAEKAMAAGAPRGVATEVEGHTVMGGGGEDFALTLPVVLEVGKGLSDYVKKSKGTPGLVEEVLPKLRAALYQDLGIRFPAVHVRTDSPNLPADEYLIYLNEVPLDRGKVFMGYLLTNENEETLRYYNLPFMTQRSFSGLPSHWVEEKYKEILDKAAIKYWTPIETVILHLSYFFKIHASEFMGIQEMRSMLEFMERSFPDLVKEVTRLIPLQRLTEIFKRLVQEQISIKDVRTIMEGLSEWAQVEKDVVLLTEYVRSALKRYISYKYSQGQNTLAVYLLDPEIEEMVRGAIKQTTAGSYLALDPDAVNMILKAMRLTITPPPPGGQPPVLLTAIDVRRFVRKLIETEFPDVAVLSYQEVIPEIRIQPLGRVQLA